MAPVVLAVELCVIVAPVAVREVNGVVPPIAPVIVTVLPVPPFKFNVCAPLIVVLNEIELPAGVPPPFVVSIVMAVLRFTGPVRPMVPPDVVKFPARLIAVDPV